MPVLLLESGDFLFDRKPRLTEETAAKCAKADLILRAYGRMKYDAVLPGEADFSAGLSLLRDHEKRGIPFICLNLVSADTGKPVFPPFRKFSRGGMRILLAGLLGEEVFPKGALAGLGWRVLPPKDALDDLLKDKEAAIADVVILLTHLGHSGDIDLAREIHRPILIFGAHSGTPLRAPVFESGAVISRPEGKGTHLLEVAVALRDAKGRKNPDGYVEGGAAERYKIKKQQLLEEMGTMEAARKKLYLDAVQNYEKALREAEGKRQLFFRTIPLDSGVPGDTDIEAMVEAYQKGRDGRP